MKKSIFFVYHSSSHLKILRTLPVLWLNQASHRNAKGTIGCRIECSIQPMGQNEASLTRKKKKNEKKIFSLYHSSSHLKSPRTLSVLWLNQASHRNTKGTIGCRIQSSIQRWAQKKASLTTSHRNAKGMQNWKFNQWVRMRPAFFFVRNQKWKKGFFRYITAVVTWKFHEHCLFSGWTKRLTEMPRAPLDAEFKAVFNHGDRMRAAWQEKKKKIFLLYHSSSHLKSPRTYPVFWLNEASDRNAKDTIGCRIECSIQPMGQNEASLTTKKRKWKKDFFCISQQ